MGCTSGQDKAQLSFIALVPSHGKNVSNKYGTAFKQLK
jgi:hypothetical protein